MTMLEKFEDSKLLGEFGSKQQLAKEPPIDWLIEDWLPSRELTILYGAPGTFKSFLALAWSLELATMGKPVVYIAAEGLSGMRPRVEAWCAQRRGNPDVEMKDWAYYNASVWFDKPDHRLVWVEELGEWWSRWPELIVVDTLDRNFSGDENSSKELGYFIDGVERIRRATGSAMLVPHHSTKKDGSTERGSSSLRAAAFAMLRLDNPAKRPSAGGASVNLTCSKMKDAEVPNEGNAMRLEFDAVDLKIDRYGGIYDHSLAMKRWRDLVKGNEAKGSKSQDPRAQAIRDKRAQKVLRLAVGKNIRRGDVMKALNCSESTAKRVLKSLVTSRYLIQKGKKKFTTYGLTTKGKERL